MPRLIATLPQLRLEVQPHLTNMQWFWRSNAWGKGKWLWHLYHVCMNDFPSSSPNYQGPSWKILLSAMLPHNPEVGKLKNELELIVMGPWGRHILSVPRFHHLYDKDYNFCPIYHTEPLGPSTSTMFSETTLEPYSSLRENYYYSTYMKKKLRKSRVILFKKKFSFPIL